MDNIINEFKKQYEDYDIISKIGLDTWQIKLKSYDKIAVLKKVDNPHIYKKLMPLKIKGIPLIYNIFEKDGKSYVIEQYINGSNLSEVLSSRGSIDKKEVKAIILKLCDILSVVHNSDIIHRDIKPSNIIYTSNGEVYLIDFGIARTKSEKAAKDTRLLGTEFYASPEQYGFAQTDCKSDIYSIGRLMLILLTGKESTENINKVPYNKIISKCTQIDAAKRYKNTGRIKRAFYFDLITLGVLLAFLFVMLCAVSIVLSNNHKNNSNTVQPTLPTVNDKKVENETSLQADNDKTKKTELSTEVSTNNKPELTTVGSTSAVKSPTTTNTPSKSNTSSTTNAPSKSNASSTTNAPNTPNTSTYNKSSSQPSTPVTNTTQNKGTQTDIKKIKRLDISPNKLVGLYFLSKLGVDTLGSDEFKKPEKHIIENLELSDSLKANIYTEWTGNEFVIKINDKNTITIPEPANIKSTNYKSGMSIKKYYSINYYDFDNDGILDIFVNEAIYDYQNNEYTPFGFANTFVKINADLTMKVLSNDMPVIVINDTTDKLNVKISDEYVKFGIHLKDEIGRYVIKNNKVSFVSP